MDREMVTHNGMPSGMAATARVTAIRNMYSHAGLSGLLGSRRSMATPLKVNTQTAMAPMPMRLPK
eukprot:14025130-Heterocapsa_arctica.AAC.1